MSGSWWDGGGGGGGGPGLVGVGGTGTFVHHTKKTNLSLSFPDKDGK